MGVRIKDNDKKYQDFLRKVKGLDKKSLKVGIQEGAKANDRKDGRIVKTNKPLAEVAMTNEFGTENIPARPFMRNAFKNNVDNIQTIKTQNYNKMIEGTRTEDMALKRLGNFLVGAIQDEIGAPTLEPNAPSTVEQKGSSKPLIDTGKLRTSITFKVTD